MSKRGWALVAVALVGCGPAIVAYPERSGRWLGSRKRTLKAGEEAVRAAMAQPGIKLVPSPGNDEPVMIEQGNQGAPTCVNGAWFTVDGKREDQLGDGFQYSWHLCVGDDEKYQLQVSCLEIKKTEQSTDSHECPSARIAKAIADRTDAIVDRLR